MAGNMRRSHNRFSLVQLSLGPLRCDNGRTNYGGRLAVPLTGSPDALYVVTLLFDYKCPIASNYISCSMWRFAATAASWPLRYVRRR